MSNRRDPESAGTGAELGRVGPVGPLSEGKKWHRRGALAVVFAVLCVLPALISGSYFLHVLCLALIYLIVSSSFRAISLSGQFCIAHATFFGLGAYTSGMLSYWLGWPLWLTIPLGPIAATIAGVIIAYPFSRLRTIYYAMGTMFLGVLVINLFTAGGKTTGSYSGLSGIPPIFAGSRVAYYYLFLGIVVISLTVLYRFEYSRIGVRMRAVAQSAMVASSVGISERRYRILAAGFGCFFAGLAGALYVHYNMTISPTSFNLGATLWIIMYVLVGGIDCFWGPAIGVVVLLILPEFFRDLKGYLPYVSAAILLVVATTLRRQGLAGLPKVIRGWITRRRGEEGVNAGAAGD